MADSSDSGFRIGHETETDRGWSYDVTVHRAGGPGTRHTVTLSWADHDLLSGGLHPPSRTMRAAMRVLVGVDPSVIDPSGLPSRFDLSTLRRMIAGFDDAVRDRME